MSWIDRYKLRLFLRASLWLMPITSMAVALMLAPLIRRIDELMQWTLMGYGPEGARLVVGALASSLLNFIVFSFSIILIAVQLAGGQLSPRIIERLLESRISKLTLSAFVFSYAYSLAALGRIEGRVPQLSVLVAVLSSLLSVTLFLYLIQKVSKSLRPIMILTHVAEDTQAVIARMYPFPFSMQSSNLPGKDFINKPVGRTIEHRGRSCVVIAFDAAGLVKIAASAGCVIELVPQVGDFLAPGEEVFRIYGDGAETLDEIILRNSVMLDSERRLEYDPAFGFRILVDIAEKALSPAINDPTTGVLALDQIGHLLRMLGQRQLDTGIMRDASGKVRLKYRIQTWEDFVALAVTEIRIYGGSNPQITRRLRAMFEHLLRVVPVERASVLHREMALLQRTIDHEFIEPEDRIRACVPDTQGLGGRMLVGDQSATAQG